MSKRNLALIKAFNKGYRVSKCGKNLITPRKEVLSQTCLKDGYPEFGVKIEKVQHNVPWHRLQAYQKYGDLLFEKGIVVRHKNDIRHDCAEENILIGTMADNNMDKSKECRLRSSLKATSAIRKYNATEVKEFYSTVKSYKKTMEHFGISSKGTLSFILNNAKFS